MYSPEYCSLVSEKRYTLNKIHNYKETVQKIEQAYKVMCKSNIQRDAQMFERKSEKYIDDVLKFNEKVEAQKKQIEKEYGSIDTARDSLTNQRNNDKSMQNELNEFSHTLTQRIEDVDKFLKEIDLELFNII